MTRRLLLLLPLALGLRADSESDARDLIASAARALSAGDTKAFLDLFDRGMPGFDQLRFNVVGLISQAEVSCNIEISSNQGDDTERSLTLDWILTIERKEDRAGDIRRQKTVKCKLKKTGKKWTIVSFDPLELLASPAA